MNEKLKNVPDWFKDSLIDWFDASFTKQDYNYIENKIKKHNESRDKQSYDIRELRPKNRRDATDGKKLRKKWNG